MGIKSQQDITALGKKNVADYSKQNGCVMIASAKVIAALGPRPGRAGGWFVDIESGSRT